MDSKGFQGMMYAEYFYPANSAPKTLSLLVVPMRPNSQIYKIQRTIKGKRRNRQVRLGNETSLKEVFAADPPLAKAIFSPYAPQDPPCFRYVLSS